MNFKFIDILKEAKYMFSLLSDFFKKNVMKNYDFRFKNMKNT